MKCNKCGTPIITGEEVCRFCGTKADFSKREIEPEVIDFDTEEETTIVKTPIVIPSEIRPNSIPVSNNVESKVATEDIAKVETETVEETKEIKYSGDLLLEDFSVATEATISPLENYTNSEDDISESADDMIVDAPVNVEEKTNDIATEEVKSEVVVEAETKKEEKVKPVKEKKENDKKIGILPIVLIVILMLSLAINVYMFLNKDESSDSDTNTNTAKVVEQQKTIYGKFEYAMPGSWMTTENTINSNLIAYDDKKTWAAAFSVIENMSYDKLIVDKDDVLTSLGTSKYLFTSDYSKSVSGKSMYLFKGKYYNYSVYVIVTKVNATTVLVTDLKFQGEVSDTVLNQILDVCASIKTTDVSTLYTENFEFNNITPVLESVLVNQ